jgi:hypothetical protein
LELEQHLGHGRPKRVESYLVLERLYSDVVAAAEPEKTGECFAGLNSIERMAADVRVSGLETRELEMKLHY